MTNPYAARRQKVFRRALKEAKAAIDVLLINRVEDVSYLSGFTGDDSFLLIWPAQAGRPGKGGEPGEACLVTDGRYSEQAAKECPDIRCLVRKGPMSQAIAEAIGKRRCRRLGVQADCLTLNWPPALAKALPRTKTVPIGGVTNAARQIKDESEVASIRKAIRAAEGALQALLNQGRKAFVGRTERQVAAELEYRMKLAGADKPSFDTIVAAGPHGSLPHYRPADVRIGSDEGVLIDWGAMVGGYCSDLTRVVWPGRIPPKMAEVYEAVRKSQLAGISAVGPGRTFKAVDFAARDVISRAGYGPQFVHGLGHGIGRQIHEMPGIGQQAKGGLSAGMVVTVEPGIYLPGVGGVRIEDDVLVTPQGRKKLSSLPTALEAMTLRR